MRRATFAAGRAIVRQGEVGDQFYLIRRGSVDVLIDMGTGVQHHAATLKEGEFFGERALLTGEPRNATVVAREEVEVYTLNKDDFQAALEASAPFKEQIYRVFFARQ
jgi:putative ABC transport system ATP-binding protein